jgi:hypothetical protein
MTISEDDAIERAKLREVAAIFHSDEALEAAAEALLLAGFDRADLDRLADLDEVRERVGLIYVAHEELADVPQAPRRPLVTREDVTLTLVLVVSVLASLAGVVVALIVVALDGGTEAAVGAALLSALVAGGISAFTTVRGLRPMRSEALKPLMAARGLILWVRVRSPDDEQKAERILHQHGGRAIRVHEIEIEKRPEEIPLSSFRPDPWLGSGPLGRPNSKRRRS